MDSYVVNVDQRRWWSLRWRMERWGGKDLKITGHGVNFRFLPRPLARAYSFPVKTMDK